MSQALRAVALSEAVKTLGSQATQSEVIAVANLYLAFLSADEQQPAPPAPAPAPTPPAPTPKAPAPKPAPKAPAPKKAPAKTEEQLAAEALEKANAEAAEAEAAEADEADGESKPKALTKDDIAECVDKMLKAGKRPEAVALLKKFGATTVSGVKAADYTKFVAEANKLVPDADLTA